MREPYLEVTFRHGRPLAGYYHLPHETRTRAARSERVESGLVVDYAEDGRPLGIEIITPACVTLEAFNAVLRDLGLAAVDEADLAPLRAA